MTKRDYIIGQRLRPLGEEGLQAARAIVASHQAAKINEVLVDATSAQVLVRIYDQLMPEHRARLLGLNVAKACSVAYRLAYPS